MRCRKSGSVSSAAAIALPANFARRVGVNRAYCRSCAGSSATVSPPKPSETICTTRAAHAFGQRTVEHLGGAVARPPACGLHHPSPQCPVRGPLPSGAGARPVHEFHLVHRVAPAAAHRLDGLTDHLALLDLAARPARSRWTYSTTFDERVTSNRVRLPHSVQRHRVVAVGRGTVIVAVCFLRPVSVTRRRPGAYGS